MSTPLIYIIAGEASGDALGADFMRAAREENPAVRFAGIGGEAMQHEGLASLFAYSELSIMGFLEVIPHIPLLLKRIRKTAQDIAQKQPDLILTIDSPGFCFRLAKLLKKKPATASIKRVHYVAPSVWAYKPGRAQKTAALFDRLLTLLPFEPPYFEKYGLSSTFVGHPVLWEKHIGDAAAFRLRHSIAPDVPLLLILPGSRKGEVYHHLPIFLEAARVLPGYVSVILAGSQVRELIRAQVPAGMVVADITEKQDAFAASTLALTKSGTISLELAVAGVPMVVAHKANFVSAWLIRRMILIQYASLVNIAVNQPIIPELIQEHCNVPEITQELMHLITPEARNAQRKQYAQALSVLRGNTMQAPGIIAAKTVLALLTS